MNIQHHESHRHIYQVVSWEAVSGCDIWIPIFSLDRSDWSTAHFPSGFVRISLKGAYISPRKGPLRADCSHSPPSSFDSDSSREICGSSKIECSVDKPKSCKIGSLSWLHLTWMWISNLLILHDSIQWTSPLSWDHELQNTHKPRWWLSN